MTTAASQTVSRTLPSRSAQTFSRHARLVLWMEAQPESVSFADVRAALPDAYGGPLDTVDRMWSRDKLLLAAAGVRLARPEPERYAIDRASWVRPVPLGPGGTRVARAIARIRPARDEEALLELETGLRKLLVAGAAIADSLLTGAPPRFSGWAPRRMLSAALALLPLLCDAGDAGLSVDEATVLSGAGDRDQLETIAGVLETLVIPELPPPCDEVGLERAGERLSLFLRCRPRRGVALTAAEAAALLRAGEELASEPTDFDDLRRALDRCTTCAELAVSPDAARGAPFAGRRAWRALASSGGAHRPPCDAIAHPS